MAGRPSCWISTPTSQRPTYRRRTAGIRIRAGSYGTTRIGLVSCLPTWVAQSERCARSCGGGRLPRRLQLAVAVAAEVVAVQREVRVAAACRRLPEFLQRLLATPSRH